MVTIGGGRRRPTPARRKSTREQRGQLRRQVRQGEHVADRRRPTEHGDVCQPPQAPLELRGPAAVDESQLLAAPRPVEGEGGDELLAPMPTGDQSAHACDRHRERHQQRGGERGGRRRADPRAEWVQPARDGGRQEREPRHGRVDSCRPREMLAAHQKRTDRERRRRGLDRLGYGVHQRCGVRVAGPGVLGQAAIHYVGEARRDARCHGGDRRRGLRDVQRQHGQVRRRMEGQPTGQGVIGDDAQRVEVAARIHGCPAGLLRTHERRRAQHGPAGSGAWAPLGAHVGDAEIGKERAAARRVEQDVVGFHIAVHHAARVRVRERLPDVPQQPHDRVGGEGPARGHALRERLAGTKAIAKKTNGPASSTAKIGTMFG